MHAYIHTYIHTHTHIHTYMHACMHAYTHTYIHTYIHTYTHTYIHTHRRTDRRTDGQTDRHIHSYPHTEAPGTQAGLPPTATTGPDRPGRAAASGARTQHACAPAPPASAVYSRAVCALSPWTRARLTADRRALGEIGPPLPPRPPACARARVCARARTAALRLQ